MSGDHYSKFIREKSEELTFRDYLALDRTLLANERSFLAYTRTAITLFIAAISLIKLFDAPPAKLLGEVFLAGALVIFIQGMRRYKSNEHIFNELEGIKLEAIKPPHHFGSRFGIKIWRFSQELVKVFYK